MSGSVVCELPCDLTTLLHLKNCMHILYDGGVPGPFFKYRRQTESQSQHNNRQQTQREPIITGMAAKQVASLSCIYWIARMVPIFEPQHFRFSTAMLAHRKESPSEMWDLTRT